MKSSTELPATIGFDARYVNDQYHGIGRHAYNLVESLTRLDPDRRYVVYVDPTLPNDRFAWAPIAARPNVRIRGVRLPLYSPLEQALWPALLARDRVDLFHTPYVPLPLLAPIPLLMTVHDLIFEHYPDYMPQRRLRALYRAATYLGTRRAAMVLTVSEATRRDLASYYRVDQGRARVIGNALDPGLRRVEDPQVLAAARARYGLPERFVLTLGAGRPHKNVELAVEAIGRLGARAPSLVIAGTPDRRFDDSVARTVAAFGLQDRVVRTGSVREEDLAALYTLADALVFPSLVEGFGLPPLEAMACGTPVIASDASSIPEVVGNAGLLFDPHDPDALARQIARLDAEPALSEELRHRGRARASAFTPDTVARRTLAVYHEVLRPNAPGVPDFLSALHRPHGEQQREERIVQR